MLPRDANIRVTSIKNRDDRRVIQASHSLRFAAETSLENRVPRQIGAQNLHGYIAAQQNVASQPHIGHAPAANQAVKLITIIQSVLAWLRRLLFLPMTGAVLLFVLSHESPQLLLGGSMDGNGLPDRCGALWLGSALGCAVSLGGSEVGLGCSVCEGCSD